MENILRALVLVTVFRLAYTQGPRDLSCERCEELEDEIGQKMKTRSTTIGIKKLETLCPLLTEKNSTIYCEYLVSSWKKNILVEEKDLENEGLISQFVASIFNWLLKSISMTNYKDICEMVHVCQ